MWALSGRTQGTHLVFQPLHRSNVQGPNFEIASTDPYFGAGEKGVVLPMNKNVELANT
jgi:hypothetical protein